MRAPLAALFVVAAGCCGYDHDLPPPTTPPVSDGHLALLGPDGAPYADAQDVTLVPGAQGGFHVWLSYRVEGVPAGVVAVSRTAHRLSDDALVLRYEHGAEVGPADADGWYQAPAPLPMFMCPSPVGLSVIDTPIVFTLDVGGATGSITLVPHCPDDQRDFCQRICTG